MTKINKTSTSPPRQPLWPRFTITRLFVVFLIAASIIPLIVVGARSYEIAHDTLSDQIHYSSQQQLSHHTRYADLIFIQVNNLLTNITHDSLLKQVLAEHPPDPDQEARAIAQAEMSKWLSTHTMSLSELVSIDILTPLGTHYHVGDALDSLAVDTSQRARMFSEVAATESIYWAGIERNLNRHSKHRQVIVAIATFENVLP